MPLTPTEQAFYTLLQHGEPVSREELLEEISNVKIPRSNSIDVHIKNLRRKINEKGEEIETLRGFGYKLKKTVIADNS